MEKKSDSDGEPAHSLWSQDTEAISLLSEENNLSMEISSSALPLDPVDSDRIGRIVPSSTACSTPHESKHTLTSKRRFECSSEDLSPKRRKTSAERVLSPVHVSAVPLSSSNGIELTNGSSDGEISTSTKMKSSVLTYVKKPAVVYAEANSSISPTEKSSNKSVESQTNSFTKGMSPPLRNLDKVKTLKQKQKEVKETKLRHITEEIVCSISYTVDETSKDIISLYFKEVNRNICDTKNASNKLSLSSGTLADVSGSEGNSVYSSTEKFTIPPKLSVTSSSSLSSVSSSSSLPSTANKLHHTYNKFLGPQVSELKKYLNYRCKGSVCQCFCSKCINCLLKPPISPQFSIPEIFGSSSEHLKIDSQEAGQQQIELNKSPTKDEKKEEPSIPEETSEEEASFPCYSSRSSIYTPSCSNLPVFGKWPGNSWFYPGIVENAEEETWHTSSHLEIKFCDGTVKKTLTANLFPAYLLPIMTEVTYENEGSSQTHIIKYVNKLPNNELLFLSESGESIPFQKICFSAAHYKELLKENSSVLTPRKTPKFSISIENVQQGKRVRKIIKTGYSSSSSETKSKVSSSAKKSPSTKTKVKRGRSTTDTSSTDQTKTEKKKIRSSNQKKLNTEAKVKDVRTPLLGELEKKEVARKLCLETPGCSYKHCKDSKNSETLEPLTSTSTNSSESSGYQEIVFDDISSPTLDVELIPDISRRHLRTKSSLKKHVFYHQKNQENVDKLGPLPEMELFSKYNFVLTHSKKKLKLTQKLSDEQSYSEEGTDFEDYYDTVIPFEHLWLREQLISGGGKVYRNLLEIPPEEYANTIVITDGIFETPNYLLAVSLGIPIYRHDLIINCCNQKKHIAQMINQAMRMPSGRSLDTGQWFERSVRNSLKGYCCLISLDVNFSTLQFWKKLLLNAGAKVIDGDAVRLISEQRSHISFIVGDATISEEVMNLANFNKIPVVSSVWVIQTIIQGKPKVYNAHPEYNPQYIPPQED